MGSTITIDKHTSTLDDWIGIENKLKAIDFQAEPQTHLVVWRIFLDEIDQSANIAPLSLQIANNGANIFTDEECYVVGLVRRNDFVNVDSRKIESEIFDLLSNLVESIERETLQICMEEGQVNFREEGYGVKFSTYSYFGKKSHNQLRLSTLSYTYKLSNFLNNQKRIKVISGGGVFRNKKLQMGSQLNLCPQNSLKKQLEETHKNIHLVKQLLLPQNQRQGLSILRYKPKLAIPIIIPETQNLNNIQARQNYNNLQNTEQEEENSHSESNNTFNEAKQQILQNSSSSSLEQENVNLFKGNMKIPKLQNLPNKNNIKPPMLKLALKTHQQRQQITTYEQMKQHQLNNQFDMRDTARHELKMKKFSNDCSEIIDGLFVSGEKVAKNQNLLKEHKITEIVNCAGDYCENWHEKVKNGDGKLKYNYLTFFLKDSQHENIQCLFYRVIDYINSAHRSKKKVLIHCIQGISRSVSFVIAYLIFMNGFDYKKAENFVKEKRAIACPNNGFMVELIQFYKRLYDNTNSLPMPRVFLVSPHRQQTPHIITARMIKHQLFDPKKYIGLDSRGMYIVQTEQILYLWVGNKCEDQKFMKKYWEYAQQYIRKLQQHEKAPMKVKAISQGKQGRDFLSIWNFQEFPNNYENQEYHKLFQIHNPPPVAGYLRKYYEREEDHEEQNQKSFQARLFIYPDYENGLGVFDLEDLSGFCIIVKSDAENVKIFVWKENNWEGIEKEEGEFLDRIIEDNYGSYSQDKIQITEESMNVNELSEEFLNCFS